MKFLMARSELSELVNGVQNIVGQRTPMPILSNILVEASDSRVVITATDLTVGVRFTGTAKVIEPGVTTIPARRLASLLKELNVSYIEVSANDKEVNQVVADSSTFRMNGMPKADYPALPDLTGAQHVVIKQKDLYAALNHTAFAVSREESRYLLTGLYLSVSDETALFIGTDGKRLARTTIPVQIEKPITYECIIPAKAVDEIVKNIKPIDENATVYLMQDKIAVEAGNNLVMTKLLAGEYPDVERVIPTHSTAVIPIHREELESLLRQTALFISDQNNSVRFTFEEGILHIAANTADIGEGKVSMAVNYSGPRFEIAFNPLFFIDVLRHSGNEYVYLGFQDAFNPVVISDVEFGTTLIPSPSPLYVLMPLRLGP